MSPEKKKMIILKLEVSASLLAQSKTEEIQFNGMLISTTWLILGKPVS